MGTKTQKTADWAIVGGTGEFAMARGVVARKVHGPITDGEMQELNISGVCFMKSNGTVLAKRGPWGTQGFQHDIRFTPKRLTCVTVSHSTVIDAITFSYIDEDGQADYTGRFGGVGGKDTMIMLGPYEHVLQVSGTISESNEVSSLKLITNFRTYGPFGVPSGTSFKEPEEPFGFAHIVGFFASSAARASGVVLTAIGTYTQTWAGF